MAYLGWLAAVSLEPHLIALWIGCAAVGATYYVGQKIIESTEKNEKIGIIPLILIWFGRMAMATPVAVGIGLFIDYKYPDAPNSLSLFASLIGGMMAKDLPEAWARFKGEAFSRVAVLFGIKMKDKEK